MRNQHTIRYRGHKRGAGKRGIPFLLTFEEWYQIWLNSGHYDKRGAKRGHYVMARFGDIGPYSVDNVKIILHEENLSEAHLGKERPEWVREKIRASTLDNPNMMREFSDETKAKISAAGIGRKHSIKTRDRFKELALNRPPEHIAKIAVSNTGKKRSEESKARMRASRLAYVDRMKRIQP